MSRGPGFVEAYLREKHACEPAILALPARTLASFIYGDRVLYARKDHRDVILRAIRRITGKSQQEYRKSFPRKLWEGKEKRSALVREAHRLGQAGDDEVAELARPVEALRRPRRTKVRPPSHREHEITLGLMKAIAARTEHQRDGATDEQLAHLDSGIAEALQLLTQMQVDRYAERDSIDAANAAALEEIRGIEQSRERNLHAQMFPRGPSAREIAKRRKAKPEPLTLEALGLVEPNAG